MVRPDAATLTRNTKTWMLLGVVLLLAVFFFYDWKQIKAVGSASAAQQNAVQKLDMVRSQLANAQSNGTQSISALEQKVSSAETLLPAATNPTEETQSALTRLTGLVSQAGLHLTQTNQQTPAAVSGQPGLTYLPIKVDVTGSFGQLSSWIASAQSATPLLTLSDSQLTNNKNTGSYSLQTTVRFWFSTLQQPAQSGAPGPQATVPAG